MVPEEARLTQGLWWQRFRPSGPRFRPLVELEVGLDSFGQIEAACLGLDRSFIAAAPIRPFARDIATSYLQWVLPTDAAVVLSRDIELIGAFCDGESALIIPAADRRATWFTWWGKHRDSAAAADAFMGTLAHASRRVGNTRIFFENLSEPLPQGVASSRWATARAVPRSMPNDIEGSWVRMAVWTVH